MARDVAETLALCNINPFPHRVKDRLKYLSGSQEGGGVTHSIATLDIYVDDFSE